MASNPEHPGTLLDSLDLIDVSRYISGDRAASLSACERMASSLCNFGAVLVQDVRVDTDIGDGVSTARFRDMMERYFSQPRDIILKDARPDAHFQVGVTPDRTELPRLNEEWVQSLRPEDKPVSAAAVASRCKDPKWRFFWRIGPRPVEAETRFPELNAPQVIPEAFKSEWAAVMDGFGNKLFTTVEVVAEMLAVGLGLPTSAFTEKMQFGPHLLAPTGSDLSLPELGSKPGGTLAGYHYDLNFLTIHAPASFPGLHIWTRGGKRLAVSCPTGALLIQAGAQLEYLTANVCSRGYHEVVVTERTIGAVANARANNKSLWRISSTLFTHIRSDESLSPLGRFAGVPPLGKYNAIAGDQVAGELKAIALAVEHL